MDADTHRCHRLVADLIWYILRPIFLLTFKDNAMREDFKHKELTSEIIEVFYQGEEVGAYYSGLLIEDKVIVE